jgi:hypothetical protein
MRFRARMAAIAGDADRADGLYRRATGLLRELATPFPMAVALLEHAELLAEAGRGVDGEPILAEARAVFARLGAVPWLDRSDRVAALRGDQIAS